MKKRVLSIMMTITIIMTMIAAQTPMTRAASFGPYVEGSLNWKVDVSEDGTTGTLAISRRSNAGANVPISNYSATNRPPWYGHSAHVTQIEVGDGISEIGDWAFADFSRVTSIIVTGNPTRIGNDAFSGCTNLAGFYPSAGSTVQKSFSGLTVIGDNAFNWCKSLEDLYISDINSIGADAFNGCASLIRIDAGSAGRIRSIGGVDGIVVEIDSVNSATVPVRVIKSSVALQGNTAPDIYSIPDTITIIDTEAFAYIWSISEFIIPEKVSTIKDRAFAYNPGLLSATFMGDAPTAFGSDVFKGANEAFKVVFFPNAQRWTAPRWQGYSSEVNNSRLTLDKYFIVLENGSSAELRATVHPNTARQAVKWTSKSPGIATVNGGNNINDVAAVVTGVSPGVATIAVEALDSGAVVECVVIVLEKGVSAASVVLDKALLTVGMDVAPGNYPTLTAIIQPYPFGDPGAQEQIARELIWNSSDPGVAYIDPSSPESFIREIIPVKPGQTIITVSNPDGSSTATCIVTVTAAPVFVPVTSITLADTTVSMGSSINLSSFAEVQPANATHSDITMKIIEEESTVPEAVITGGVLNVPWGRTGTIVIEANVEKGSADVDWGYSANAAYIQRFSINVVSFLPVTNISDVPNLAFAGKPLQLTGTVNPPGAVYKEIEWSIGNKNTALAYIDAASGMLTPQQPGEVIVIATVKNGVLNGAALVPFTQEFTIRVNPYTANILTLRADPGGSVRGAGTNRYAGGETIVITAIPNQGYIFAGWYSTNGGEFEDPSLTTTQFTMPANETIVTAYFAFTGLPAGSIGGGGGGVVLPTPTHYFTYGSVYTRGTGVNFAHVTIRDFQLFSSVILDGRTLARDQHYTAGFSGGFTEITLVSGYLDTLTQGQHTLEIHFKDRVSVFAVFSVLVTPQLSQQYDDVYISNWFYSDVLYVSERGWMTSAPSEPRRFRPSDPVTQGEAIDALYRMIGSPTILDQYNFALQGRDAAYEWVKASGIMPIGGYYNLDNAITRQDIVVILDKLVSIMNLRYTSIRSAPNFEDEWQIHNAALLAVTNLYRAGIISGRTWSTFVPLGNMTRAEFAAILRRSDEALR